MRHPEIENRIEEEFWKMVSCWSTNHYYEYTDAAFKKVVEKYNEKHRFYHDLVHIDMNLNELKKFSFGHDKDKILYIATFLHDVIYDTLQSDKKNVLQSAEYVKHGYSNFGLNYEESKEVCELIKFTDYSKKYSKNLTIEQQVMQDLDLVIFGQPAPVFDQYDENIRKEYWWVPPLIYQEKRKEVLEGFLSRKYIYQTTLLGLEYEENAKQNLKRAIKRLKN
ncbi:MAG: hypothetical protein KKF46_08390 [Nanoarchaeota archaeon]|nr:hypothetical protein [Nanoarchaeota archaeon]MBU1322348.1 hypothetical protein [Nanoarchaeota archaeon]MBU1598206.1 hypothetical protein [Nanoarchaeota archaeon]MBU2440971.1 hypothetical protein [Nanoarchaeota archaeon]